MKILLGIAFENKVELVYDTDTRMFVVRDLRYSRYKCPEFPFQQVMATLARFNIKGPW